MTSIDRYLQRWRFSKVRPYLTPASRVLDIGAADGALYAYQPHVARFVGIDPDAEQARQIGPTAQLLRGTFPDVLDPSEVFDVIAMLAVLEHVPPRDQGPLARACATHLAPGGVLVITVPSPVVDRILAVLMALGLVHGMAVEQHYGFEAARTPAIFVAAGLALVDARRFQLGVNNLFVFVKPA